MSFQRLRGQFVCSVRISNEREIVMNLRLPVLLFYLTSGSTAFAASGMIHEPTTATPAIVKPGQSYNVVYSYDVSNDPQFDPNDGVRVYIERRVPGSNTSVFNAHRRTGSSSKSVSSAISQFEIPKAG
jgi:hypothetical protein